MTEHLEHCNEGTYLPYILLIFFFFSQAASAQQYPDRMVHHLLNDGINKIIDQDYSGAEIAFATLNKKYPELPLGNIYLAAVKIARSVDYGEEFNAPAIEDRFKRAELQCNLLLKKKNDDVWNNYFYALLKGYTAYFQALRKDYFSAFTNAFTSINHFEKCLKSDSTFNESFVALGSYKYWKSQKTEFLQWLPFISDEREIGIKYLEKSLENPSYNYHLAVNSLIWIYLDNNQVNEAINLAEKALKRHPESRQFKWSLAAAYQHKDKAKSISIFKEILSSVMRLPQNNHYNEIVLKHKIAMLYNELGEDRKALEFCNEILRIPSLSAYTTERLENRMERVRKLRKELTGS